MPKNATNSSVYCSDIMDIFVSPSGVLTLNNREFKCALGKGGVTHDKKEGDGATPFGCFHIREVMYRADKLTMPKINFPISVISKNDGWCDDVNDPNYNKKIKLPYSGSHEELWRDDDVYDIIIPLGYNDDPAVSGKGSAIFIHVARPNYTPTAGCIALSLLDLLEILKEVPAETRICVKS